MSWDIFVMDLPPGVRRIEDVPKDFQPKRLGARNAIADGIRSVAPDIDFTDPTWGVIDGDGYTIEVNLGADDPVESFALHVHGGGAAADLIAAILAALDLRAVDPQSESGLFDPASATESFRRWQEFRDRASKEMGRT